MDGKYGRPESSLQIDQNFGANIREVANSAGTTVYVGTTTSRNVSDV